MTAAPYHLSEAAIKRCGAHYTPPVLADFLAERALERLRKREGGITVLDPACGNAGLLTAIVRNAPPTLRSRLTLVGYETDGEAMRQARSELSEVGVPFKLVCGDFLDAADSVGADIGTLFAPKQEGPGVDLVISNPPYVRTQVLGAAALASLPGGSG